MKKELFSENVLSDRIGYFCVPSVRELSFSPKIRSSDMVSYGVEADYLVRIKFFGQKGNYSDYDTLEKASGEFLTYIGLSGECIPIKLERGEIYRNSTLKRLESEALAQIKILILSTESEEEQ